MIDSLDQTLANTVCTRVESLGIKVLSNTDLNKNQSNAFSFFLLKSDLVRSKSGHEFKLFPAKMPGL